MNAVTHISSTATSNTCLAAALTAIGIPLAEKPFVRVVGDGIRGERIVWFFEPQSHCGKFETKALIEAWNDDSWHLAHPEHPFAYIKCAMLNRQRLVDKVKQDVPLACVMRRGKIAFIPLDATPAIEDFYHRQRLTHRNAQPIDDHESTPSHCLPAHHPCTRQTVSAHTQLE